MQLPSGSPSTLCRATADHSEKQLVRSLNRLFVDWPEFFSSTHPRRDCVTSAVVCIALKAFAEAVRFVTFSESGLRQVQADSYFIAVKCARFATDEHLAYTLLDEVVASAVNRTIGVSKDLIPQEKLDDIVSS
jgi:hypothetical protein